MAEVRTFLICLLARPFSVVDRISLNHAVTNWLIVDSADILVTSDRKPLAIMVWNFQIVRHMLLD